MQTIIDTQNQNDVSQEAETDRLQRNMADVEERVSDLCRVAELELHEVSSMKDAVARLKPHFLKKIEELTCVAIGKAQVALVDHERDGQARTRDELLMRFALPDVYAAFP